MDFPRLGLRLLLFALLACGGGREEPTGTATVTGTLRGQSFSPRDAISAAVELQTTTGPQGNAAIIISGTPGLCPIAAAHAQPRSTQFMLLYLQDSRGGQVIAPAGPGDFEVNDASSIRKARVSAFTLDARCEDQPGLDATGVSGTVHLTSVTNGAYAGTFDLRLHGADGSPIDHVTGDFDATACPAVATLVEGGASCR